MLGKRTHEKSAVLAIGLAVIFSWIGAALLQNSAADSEKRVGRFLYPPETLKHFTLGFDESVADSFWLRVIQDFDYCDQEDQRSQAVSPLVQRDARTERQVASRQDGDSSTQGEASLPSTSKAFAFLEVSRPAKCERGWVYNMINTVTDLAPRFRLPYSLGATTLSILVDDRQGAADIFDKGVQQYPNDWVISYRAAYHHLYEMNNFPRAAALLTRAGENGAPYWVRVLAARLYTEVGQIQFGRSVLLSLLEQYPEGDEAERIQSRLQEIEERLKNRTQ